MKYPAELASVEDNESGSNWNITPLCMRVTPVDEETPAAVVRMFELYKFNGRAGFGIDPRWLTLGTSETLNSAGGSNNVFVDYTPVN